MHIDKIIEISFFYVGLKNVRNKSRNIFLMEKILS